MSAEQDMWIALHEVLREGLVQLVVHGEDGHLGGVRDADDLAAHLTG